MPIRSTHPHSARAARTASGLPVLATRLLPPLAALLLAACSSTPLPPWPAQSSGAPGAQPGRVVPRPLGSQPAMPQPQGAPVTQDEDGVTVTPLGATDAGQPPPVAEPATPRVSAVQAALDARYADPSVRYETPGLAAGRRAFTTNAELGQWLRQLAGVRGSATHVQVLDFGRSQRGTPLQALVLTRAAGTDAAALDASQRPTVLLLGQQHGDEPASAEALLVLARELAPGGLLEPMLDALNVVIVPRANPDGAEAGQRLLADGSDLNRDHLALRSPEAQALARLVRNYRPIAIVDAHEYAVAGPFFEQFGALLRPDLMYAHATVPNQPEFMARAAREWYEQPMARALGTAGLTQDWYHAAGHSAVPRLDLGGIEADSARNVNGLKNAVSLMIASRGSDLDRQHLQRRVHTQVAALTSVLRSTIARAGDLESVRSYDVREAASQACRGQMTVRAQGTPLQRELLVLDPASAQERPLHLQADSPQQLRPLLSRARPCGYWLAPHAGAAVERLRMLGLQVLRVAEAGAVLADQYEPSGPGRGSQLQVTLRRNLMDVPASSYYVPLGQPLGNLAVAALEPDTDAGYLSLGVLNQLSDTARIMGNPSLIFEEMD